MPQDLLSRAQALALWVELNVATGVKTSVLIEKFEAEFKAVVDEAKDPVPAGITGYYYLHVNGDLIYKHGLDAADGIRDSDLARAMWPCTPRDREQAWSMLVEALALGARPKRIRELANNWNCTDEDADVYAARVGCYFESNGETWCAWPTGFVLQDSVDAGDFKKTKLEAMAELCKALGYQGGKPCLTSFKDLLAEAG